MPKNGYTEIVDNILNHENITVQLNTPFDETMLSEYDHVFLVSTIRRMVQTSVW